MCKLPSWKKGFWSSRCLSDTAHCETTVDYHLQQVHAYLLTMSTVKKSDVPAFHVSSGMGHDALVMTTTAKDRLVSVFSSTEWPTEIIYHRREVAVVGMQWSYKIAVKLKSSENYRTPTRLWETVIIIIIVSVACTKSIHSTMPCTHSPDWYLPYLHLGIFVLYEESKSPKDLLRSAVLQISLVL